MSNLKIFLDDVNYPEVSKLISGQRVTLTLSGEVISARGGAMISIDSISVGRKSKLSTQEVLLRQANDRLGQIKDNLPGQQVRV